MDELTKLFINLFGDEAEVVDSNSLRVTVSDMCSDDYRRRFKAEYRQTVMRYHKLSKYISQCEQGKAKINGNMDLLKEQLFHMQKYIEILHKRSLVEGISLV